MIGQQFSDLPDNDQAAAVVLEDANHFPMVDYADESSLAIANWLKTHKWFSSAGVL
jgi:hypothetical protein